ncbi:MAG: glycerol-3-phosphate acyltransferase [Chloroflexi bacterium]|nr:glycerol-3-phosphate acyltransferase [Chloroflexota bacterium]
MTIDSLLPLIVSALAGYLLGAIPSGYIAVRIATGQDVRTVGSGRTGGTNVYRAAGRWPFIATIAGDIAKGALSVLLARLLFGGRSDPLLGATLGEIAPLVAGFAALLGNNWSIYLRGRGGAGVMTLSGTMLVLAPIPLLIYAPFPALLVRLTRIASIGSLVAAGLAPFYFGALVYFGLLPGSLFVYVLASAMLLIVVHAPNIERLRQGKERKFGDSAQPK